MSNLQAALDYANKGFKILPVRLNKAPYNTNGKDGATTDIEVIKKWWATWPDALIGIHTTMYSPTPFGYVLDIDMDGEKQGGAELQALERQYEQLPPTLIARTGGGGLHYVFHSNNPNLKGVVGFKPNLDFRAEGNYIVVAPSITPKGAYEWLNDLNPAQLPEWLENLIVEGGSRNKLSLNTAITEGFVEGSRDDGLFKKAAQYVGKAVPYQEASIILNTIAANCKPPHSEEETQRALNSAYGNADYDQVYKFEVAALADRFANDYKYYLKFIPALNYWITWTDKYWKRDDMLLTDTLARAIPEKVRRGLVTVENKDPESAILKVGKAFLKQITHFSVYSRIPQHAAHLMSISYEECNKDDYKLGLSNGVLDLKTNTLITGVAAKNLLITYHSPVEFNPKARCPNFVKFMKEIFGFDKDIIGYMQRFIGYTLTGSSQERALLILHGNGSNGKSLLLKVLRELMGSYARLLNAAVLMKSTTENATGPDANIASLAGRRFIMTSETGNHQRLNENLVKQLTGDEPLSARAPYAKEALEFDVKFKMFMATNHKPYIDDVDPAIWARVKMIPFTQRFLEPEDCSRPTHHPINRTLYDTLVKELPGIMNWAVEGCLQWQSKGLREPAIIKQATAAFKSDSDIIGEWVEGFTTGRADDEVIGADLYNSYAVWCANNNTRAISRNAFSRRIGEQENIELIKVMGKRGFRGIGIKAYSGDDDALITAQAKDRAELVTLH